MLVFSFCVYFIFSCYCISIWHVHILNVIYHVTITYIHTTHHLILLYKIFAIYWDSNPKHPSCKHWDYLALSTPHTYKHVTNIHTCIHMQQASTLFPNFTLCEFFFIQSFKTVAANENTTLNPSLHIHMTHSHNAK